jgi:hypothetical protein
MSEPENFLTRWSRRKSAADEPKQRAEPPVDDPEAGEKKAPAVEQASLEPASRATETPTFDLSSLPPIESIVAGTDIRPFLAPGVPAELTRAALRRAWLADPKIRDFVGPSENAWDFTKPGVPGFGPLLSTDSVKKMIAEIFNEDQEPKHESTERTDSVAGAATDPVPVEESGLHDPIMKNVAPDSLHSSAADQRVIADRSEKNIATQNESGSNKDVQPTPKRTHGGAIPR